MVAIDGKQFIVQYLINSGLALFVADYKFRCTDLDVIAELQEKEFWYNPLHPTLRIEIS